MKTIRRIFLALIVLLIAALGFVYLKHGTGQMYPDTSTAPLRPTGDLQAAAMLVMPPGNVTVAPDGRVFFNTHPFAQAQRFDLPTLFELVDGKPVPYPSMEFQKKLQGTFGLKVDQHQRLWMIEPRGLDHARTRLLAIDLRSGNVAFEHWFEEGQAQFTQDLRISPDGNTVYLADTGLFRFTPANLLILDVASKKHRTVFETEPTAQPQNWITRRFDGKPHKLGYGLVSFTVGLDGIEISADGQWLYYATMSHDSAYRISTAALRDASLSAAQLSAKIEKIGNKPLSDGITLGAQGQMLITDIENGAVAQLGPDGKLQTLVRNPKIVWSDGVALGPDGALWLTDSGIPAYLHPLALPPSREALQAKGPYGLWKLPAM